MKPWVSQAEMVARIEALRMDEAPPRCPACSCTAKHNPETRRCSGPCERTLPLEMFALNRGKATGRRYECKDCSAVRQARYRRRRQIMAFRTLRAALERVS